MSATRAGLLGTIALCLSAPGCGRHETPSAPGDDGQREAPAERGQELDPRGLGAGVLSDLAGRALELEPAPSEPAGDATYHREIARILQANCVECHHTGGTGPFSLETHPDVLRRKSMIRSVVDERVMPPWFAAEGTGPWLNDRSLTEEDRRTLLGWIAAGAPEGDPADAPLPRAWPAGWTIGEPDLVLSLAKPFQLPAEGIVDIQYLATDRVIPEDLWISGMQLLPGAPEVVHHATVTYLPPSARGDELAGELQDRLLPWGKRPDRWQFLCAYLPGRAARREPEGIASFVPKGARVRFEMHYTPKGVATSDLTRLGLVLAHEPPALLAEARNVRDYDIAIPPHAADVSFTFDYTLRHDVTLRSLTPHMHLRGAGFRADLLLPDGSTRNLLRLSAWDPDWQSSYVFREPPFVPCGSRVRITGWFDNSAANPNNPDPAQWVLDGPQIYDEMLTLVIEWIRPLAQ